MTAQREKAVSKGSPTLADKQITIIFPARQAAASATSRKPTTTPKPPCWASVSLTEATLEYIDRTRELVHQHNWTEARFRHAVTFGFGLTRPAPEIADSESLWFMPALTEIIVLHDGVLATATDRHTGIAVETSALTTQALHAIFNTNEHLSTIYSGEEPDTLKELYGHGHPCPTPRRKI